MEEAKELSPMQIAEQRMPEVWYEYFGELHHYTDLAGIYFFAYGISATYQIVTGSYSWEPHLISGCSYLLSELFDNISTIKGLDAANLASKYGVVHDYQEGNLHYSDIKNSEKFLYNPKKNFLALLGLGLSTLYPGFGFPVAALKVVASLNNFRKSNRLNLAVNIAQNHLFPE